MEKDIIFEIKTEHIQALLEGKKIVMVTPGKHRVVLIPDRYGVFIPYEKFNKLRKIISMTSKYSTDDIFKEAIGDEFEDLFKKIIKK